LGGATFYRSRCIGVCIGIDGVNRGLTHEGKVRITPENHDVAPCLAANKPSRVTSSQKTSFTFVCITVCMNSGVLGPTDVALDASEKHACDVAAGLHHH
jgi:hypothetical protein